MLNDEQSSAVSCPTHTAVIACPGSGKTKTLIAKAVALIRAGCQELVIVTFTNATAKEIKHRLSAELDTSIVDKYITTGTFHSILLNHIKRHAKHLKMMPSAHEHTKIHSILIELCLKEVTVEEMKEYISTPPSSRITNEELDEVAKIFKEYLLETKQFTLSNVIEISTELMSTGELPLLPAAHMFVDEYQDVDEWQLKFVVIHGLNGTIVTFVGDDDQAIYGWRAGLGMDAFTTSTHYLNAHQITLNTNYRSKQEILNAATEVIQINQHRIEKDIVCHQGEGGTVTITVHKTDFDEALFIRDRLKEYSEAQLAKERIFVIARSNRYLQILSSVLTEARLPFLNLSGMSVQNDIIQLLITSLLGVSGDVKAMISMLRVIFPQASNEIYQCYIGKSKAPQHQAFVNMLRKGASMAKSGEVDTAIKVVIDGVFDAANNANLISREEESQFAYQMRTERLKKYLLRLKGTLKQRLSILTQRKNNDIPPGITVMTMHGSKGLEAEYVYVIGVALHIIPNKKALNDAYEISEDKYMKLIEEERRLLYVSMTRAENNLYMSTVLGDEKNPNKYGYCELLPAGFYQKYEVAVLSSQEQS